MSIIFCKSRLESNVDDSAYQQELKHEVVQGLPEKDAEWGTNGRVLLVSSEMLHSNI
jgi:hypothetical protein